MDKLQKSLEKLLTIDDFREWVEGYDETTPLGMPRSAFNCPIAEFVKERLHPHPSVTKHSVKLLSGPGSEAEHIARVDAPKWVHFLVFETDKICFEDATRSRLIRILDEYEQMINHN